MQKKNVILENNNNNNNTKKKKTKRQDFPNSARLFLSTTFSCVTFFANKVAVLQHCCFALSVVKNHLGAEHLFRRTPVDGYFRFLIGSCVFATWR